MAEEKDVGLNVDVLSNIDENKVKEIFDDDYQNKFIKVFMEDVEFYDQVADIIVPDYFGKYQKQVVNKIIKYISKNNGKPDYNDLQRQIKKDEKIEQQKTYLTHLVDKIRETEVRSSSDIKDTALFYFKKKGLANALYKMAEAWHKDDFDAMVAPLTKAMTAGEANDSGLDYDEDIMSTLTDDVRNPVATIPELDALIGGGLSYGELGVVMAPTGGGKSMMLVILACFAYLNGSNVVYYSLELGQKYVARRFHACLNDIHQAFLKFYPDVIKERAEEVKSRGGKLIIKKFKGQASIQSIKGDLAKKERDSNFKPDIVMIDYADLLKPEEIHKEHTHTLQALYRAIRYMGDELGFPIWSATQTNRSGAKTENVGIDTISDAYAKAAELDLLVSIGKNDEEKNVSFDPNNIEDVVKPNSRFGMLKNRFGPDGFFMDAILDPSRVYFELFDQKKQDKKENKRSSANSVMENLDKVKVDVKSSSSKKSSEDFEKERLENLSEEGISDLMKQMQ